MTEKKYTVSIGDRFGNWVVIDAVEDYIYPSHEGRTKYLKGVVVQCPHGVKVRRQLSALYSGITKGCVECGRELKFKGAGDLSMSYLNSIQRGAEIRQLEYSVTPEYLWLLFVDQDKKCELSGLDISLDPQFSTHSKDNTKKYTQTASLDRIDNTKGYVEENVQWLHKTVNMMKKDFIEDDFIELCDIISKNRKGEPRIRVIGRTQVEGIHRWKNCPIEEVSYLRDYHRHIFHITAKCYVTHSDRDVEFIKLSHDIKTYLTNKYFNEEKQCLFFDDNSCEMIAEELVNEFDLYECEVNEDNEGGSIVRNR